jgi:hypothetical protein
MTVFALSLTAADVQSAPLQNDSPDWPCQQRLVPQLATAAFWNEPSPGSLGDWRADPEVAGLVRRLAPRRVSTQEGLSEIASWRRALSGNPTQQFALAFLGLLEETNRERAGLIEQLKQIGRRQRELTDLAAKLAAELNSIPSEATGEAALKRVDLQQRYDFTLRNFEEIQSTIRYACETPVELEARLGAWARALQQQAAP